ncbi:MAG: ABC-F family ATP-binding cassette domain-containing protein [Longicatena sp.]|nr:ABC-F family ATP-binding cassette domain-containing protein [Longicatena sp.]
MKYQINKGSKSYGGNGVFENIQFEIRNTEKIAVVGRNGCGKTTLMRIISEMEDLDKGEIHKENGLQIGYLAQTTFENEDLSVEEALMQSFEKVLQMENQLRLMEEQMSERHDEAFLNSYAKLQQAYEEAGGYQWQSEMMNVFTRFGFEIEDIHRPIHTFSGGQKTRLAFVKLLLSKPDILLLDEPTNHLDIMTIEWLQGYVKRYPKAVVVVSHDRMFLDDVCDVVYELEYGTMRRYVGNYTNYVNVKKQDVEQQRSAYIRQQKEIKRMEELIEKFRYKKNKAAFAQSKIKYLERMDVIENPEVDQKSFKARFQPAIKGGKNVLSIAQLGIGYDQELCNVTLELMRGQKVAVIGANGCGKSTLMKTLMGDVAPLSGSFLYGHQIDVGYFDQELAQFQSGETLLEEVWKDFPDLNRTEARSALGCFLFTGDDVFKTVDVLSGGEKVRLSFVKLMLSQPNLLLMDEPTNHLDLIGKEALEEALQDYEGTMLFVSHDRYFISKLATALVVIENNQATYIPLTYNEYMEKNKQEVKVEKQQVRKGKERGINYKREVKKIEEKIANNEKQIETLKQLRFEPEYYNDYQKMQELDENINNLENELVEFMMLWEEYSECLEMA